MEFRGTFLIKFHNIWLKFIFLIFLFFALSFFGYYDITLPSSIANKSSKAEEAGNDWDFLYGINLWSLFHFLVLN